jgi:hypothetical protein
MNATTNFTLGGKEYKAPPLNLRRLRQAWPVIARVMKAPPQAMLDEALKPQNLDPANLEEMPEVDGFMTMMEYTFERTRAGLELIVIAVGGNPEAGEADALENSLDYSEAMKVPQIAMDILINSGFLKPNSDADTGGNGMNPEGSPSTGTSTGSSQS